VDDGFVIHIGVFGRDFNYGILAYLFWRQHTKLNTNNARGSFCSSVHVFLDGAVCRKSYDIYNFIFMLL
jgi:hypothetical protein